jgi:hypothetical protein
MHAMPSQVNKWLTRSLHRIEFLCLRLFLKDRLLTLLASAGWRYSIHILRIMPTYHSKSIRKWGKCPEEFWAAAKVLPDDWQKGIFLIDFILEQRIINKCKCVLGNWMRKVRGMIIKLHVGQTGEIIIIPLQQTEWD